MIHDDSKKINILTVTSGINQAASGSTDFLVLSLLSSFSEDLETLPPQLPAHA